MPYYRCRACGAASYSAAGHSAGHTCPSCTAPLPDEAYAGVPPPPAIRCSFPSIPESVGRARRTLSALALPEEAREQLALLVSELMTNAIKHARVQSRNGDGPLVDVLVIHGNGEIHLSVRDRGPGFAPPPRGRPAPSGGFGLLLVDALAKDWAVQVEPGACTVSCTVAAPSSQTHPDGHPRLRLIYGRHERSRPTA